jgi:N-acetylneuraminic acid mutarotase
MKKLSSLIMIFKVKGLVYLLPFIIVLVACKKESPASLTTTNEKPVAIAGPDVVISLDSFFLSGGNSYKNGGAITGFLWTKIYGPDTLNIKNPTEAKTVVSKLVQGVYGFELKVTDNSGLFAKDTIQITVVFPPPTVYPPTFCDNSSRPQLNVQLIPVGILSELRYEVVVASAGNKILFAGGHNETGSSSRVDIFDVTSQAWSTAELTVPGYHIKAVTSGNKIFFAGGEHDYGFPSKFIDIYDATTNTWSVDSLSQPRFDMTIGAVGNKVFFAGGEMRSLAGDYSSIIEIYDLSTRTWTTTNFNVGRIYMTTLAANDKLYFTGGLEAFHDDPTDQIDIYDNATNSWSVSRLSEPKIGLAAIAVADKIYWAGGANRSGSSCSVEIKDLNTGTSSSAYLYKTGDFTVDKAVIKDGKIIFRPRYYQEDKFDIYDIGTNNWHIGVLPLDISFPSESIISVNNTIYIAGAIVNGIVLSNQIWKLEF